MASNCETTEITPSLKCCDCLTAEAEYWCDNCNSSYCSVCCAEIHERRAFASHQTIAIREKPLEVVRCQVHLGQTTKYWCHACEKLACLDCLMLEHQNHQCDLIGTAAKNVSTELRSKLEKVQLSLEHSMKHAVQMTDTNEKMNTDTITNVFTLLRIVIDEEEKALKQQILEIETKNKILIEEYQIQLKCKEQRLNERKRYFESIVSDNDHIKLLQTKGQLTTDSTEITKELEELKPPTQTEYHIKGIDQVQASIDGMLRQIHIVVQTPESVQSNQPLATSQRKLRCSNHSYESLSLMVL